MTTKLRLAFIGTPDFAVSALRALAEAGHEIVAVYCQPPKPVGRGHQVQKTPVHLAAEEMGFPVYTPRTLRDPEEQKRFADLNLDVAVIAALGLILPASFLNAPRFGCINIHASLLPRWRGAAPIQRSILAGDAETGITIMLMDAGLDTGAMLLQESVAITPKTTAGSLHDDLASLGGRLIVRALDDLKAGKLYATLQPQEGITYAAKLTREDGRIDWNRPAFDLERQVRGLQPWPGCFFMLKDEPIKLLSATFVSSSETCFPSLAPPSPALPAGGREQHGSAGTLLDDKFTIACGSDALRCDVVQRAGKKPSDGASFLRGLRLIVGQTLHDG